MLVWWVQYYVVNVVCCRLFGVTHFQRIFVLCLHVHAHNTFIIFSYRNSRVCCPDWHLSGEGTAPALLGPRWIDASVAQ